MTIDFDPGYTKEPFTSLCKDYESSDYPKHDFRVEWGPIFHRGRLNGTARLLVIGQDPATHEDVVRRILVGTAGHRVQGFMSKLGINKSYVLLNTFLYSVASQQGGEHNKDKPSIVDYRNRWFAAVIAQSNIKAVVAFGGLADHSWKTFLNTVGSANASLPYEHVKHPTWPESAGGDVAGNIKTLLGEWNAALQKLKAPLNAGAFTPYGEAFKPAELVPIPSFDLPPGLPTWMLDHDGWSRRVGATADEKRRTLQVVVPEGIVE